MSERPPIAVVVVDDHDVVRHGVRAYFATQPDLEVVGEAATGEEALAIVERWRPDVVVLDLHLPGADGAETAQRLRATAPATRVVVLTSFAGDEEIFPALRAGALSYLLKDASAEELATAVRRAARGEPTLSPSVARRLMADVAGADDEPLPDPLTPREVDVLRLIAAGLANHEIAERLDIAEATVKGHVGHLLSKLGLSDRTQAAVYAWRTGVVSRDDAGR